MRADRLLSVLLLLQAKGRFTERELAERLEVSQRTIHRDLEALSAARVPVVALRGAQGGWELEKGWRTQVPGLDESELRALLMAAPRALGHPRLTAAAESALNKLMASLPGPARIQATAMRERLHVDPTGWRDTGEDLSMLATVQEAVARDRRLAFDYTRADGQKAPRTVDPLGLVAKGMSWYLVGRADHGMRTYKVSRMQSATLLAVGFKRPARFNLLAHWKHSTTELERQRNSFSAVLALRPETERRLRTWSSTEPASEFTATDGWAAFKVDFDSELQAKFVILGLGAGVRVLAPESLRGLVAKEIQAMAAAETQL
ncbi:MAG TPA: WYL domain-containing protein [Terracidiphilus sp.]|nr:WYL domain-containing protein [Terracidiphilus sp.]